ncbi:hypothetical protein K1719_000219 [Acacia pycnantha]|nr:hypothetical protein K1719_000219 [Acacia pycnantha]
MSPDYGLILIYRECPVLDLMGEMMNVVGLVTNVSKLDDVIDEGEIIYQLNFQIMDECGNSFHCCFRGTPAFWANVSYSKVLNKEDVVVALLFVNMIRTRDGEIIFLSHCDLSEAIFNHNHPAIVNFRHWLARESKVNLIDDNLFTAPSRLAIHLGP